MLFGSVPSPPRNPKSSTSTQSARQSRTNAASAGRITSRRPVRKATPIAASAITATRLTAKPLPRTTDSNPDTRSYRNRGCEACVIDWIMLVSVPGWPFWLPCQKPRPGQACSTAIPIRNSPKPASTARPSRGVRQLRSGRASSPPATT